MTDSRPISVWVKMRDSLRTDLFPSIVVFLVSLPLNLGIAIASGAPPATGVIAGIIGGIVVGALAGSPLQVSGPAAGLTVIVYGIVQEHGLEALGVIVLLAGLMQLAAGLLSMGQWFRAVSPAVIHGMLAGIGVLIFASQFHIMVDDEPRGSGWANIASLPESLWRGIMPLDGSAHHWAARMGLLTIVTIVLWNVGAPKKLKLIPAPLLGVLLATGMAYFLGLPIDYLGDKIPDNILEGITLPTAATLALLTDTSILLAAAGMALVCSAQTLLTATAVDQMHNGVRTKYDRELAAQGVGNALCGLVGAIPMAGVIVRSATNVQAGGKTRASAILHGVWLLLFVALLPGLLRHIPISSLAAVLVYTGYKLVNIKTVRMLYEHGRGEAMIYFATLGTIVFVDLLVGVIVGVVLAAVKLLWRFSRLEIAIATEDEGRRTVLRLRGTATFICLPKLAAALEQVRPGTELHVHLEHLEYIDHACLDLLINWHKQHTALGGKLVMDWESLTGKFRDEEPQPAADAADDHAEDKEQKRATELVA